MSTTSESTPDGSPIQALHNPAHAAQVHVPQAPLGNATNALLLAPGLGGKALLAKKMATQGSNKAYVSPSDLLMTPCTAKLNQVKKKHFNKGKPILFAFAKPTESATTVSAASTQSSLSEDTTRLDDTPELEDDMVHASENSMVDVQMEEF